MYTRFKNNIILELMLFSNVESNNYTYVAISVHVVKRTPRKVTLCLSLCALISHECQVSGSIETSPWLLYFR